MASRSVELEIQLKNAKSINDLDATIKDINKELKTLDVNSQAFADMSDLAKKANGSLNDVKDSLKDISDEKKLDSVAKIGGALAASFSIATVAASAFGAETEKEIQKAIQVASSLNVVVSGIKPIMEALSSSNRKAFAAYIQGFKESALGAKLFGSTTRAALTATGIGLFIVALGTIVAYWDQIAEAIGIAGDKQEEYFNKQVINLKIANALLDDQNAKIEQKIKLLGIQGGKEDEISQLNREQLVEEQKLLQKSILLYQARINTLNDEIETKQKSNRIFGFNENFGLDDQIAKRNELNKQLQEYGKQLQNVRDQFDVLNAQDEKRNQLERDANKKKQDDLKKLQDAKMKAIKAEVDAYAREIEQILRARIQAEIAAEKNITQLRIANLKERQDQELAQLDFDTKNKIEALQGSEAQITQQTLLIEEQRNKDVVSIRQKYRDLDVQKEQERLKKLDDQHKEDAKKKEEQFKKDIEAISTYSTAALDAFNQITTAFSDAINRQIDNIETRLDIINTQFQESVATQQAATGQLSDAEGARREALIASIQKEQQTQKKLSDDRRRLQNEEIKSKNKQNQIEYANAIISSVINTALGVVKALPVIPLSIIAGVLGAIQTGIIIANKPEPIPLVAASGGAPYGFTGPGGATDSTGERRAGGPVQLHANEWVAPRWMVENPVYGSMIQHLEMARTARPMAVGGFSSEALPPITPDVTSVNALTAQSIKAAVESAKIYVAVTEVRDANTNVDVLESRASIGAVA